MKSKVGEASFVERKGSVFEQLGYPNAVEMHRKTLLMHVITDAIKRQGLTQNEAGKKVGLSQADISRIGTGKGFRFSMDRLLTIIHRLGIDVELTQRHDEDGQVIVHVRELAKAPAAY
jgi:predicted XRE-type DNA-binding protein